MPRPARPTPERARRPPRTGAAAPSRGGAKRADGHARHHRPRPSVRGWRPVLSAPVQPPVPAAHARWALYLDFDGTLAELAGHPDEVRVDPALAGLLALLGERLHGALAVVSGRSIDDLDRMLHPSRPAAAGQHGLEHRDGDGRRVRAADTAELAAARTRLHDFMQARPGLLLEDKGGALALHYRSAPELEDDCRAQMQAALGGLPRHHVLEGKMVLELKPCDANKGEAIRRFSTRAPFRGRVPVFAGDDRTDEDGFDWVNANGGISVKVGPGETRASCRVADVSALHGWLAHVARALPEARA